MLMPGALTGVTVLDLSRLLPGPYCSMILADHGADVIAIEDTRFREDGLYFTECNRNKRHMSLNLKSSQGKEIFYRLVEDADVVLEGFRPGVVNRLGVDYDTLKEHNDRIIYCSISGYGQTGPRSDEPGHDVNYLSTAGVLDLIGEKDGPPVIPAVQVADICGGSMQAAIGILLALCAREKSGKGQYIDISMTDGILGLLTLPRFFQNQYHERPERSNVLLSHKFACYNTYRTRDGRYVSLGAVENRFWEKICTHFKRPEYAALQYDEEHRLEVISWLRGIFAEKTLKEWESELNSLNVCFSAVSTLDEVMTSDLFREREMIWEYTDKEGRRLQTLGVPVKLTDTPGTFRTPPAEFGEHTEEVLKGLGYNRKAIQAMTEDGVI